MVEERRGRRIGRGGSSSCECGFFDFIQRSTGGRRAAVLGRITTNVTGASVPLLATTSFNGHPIFSYSADSSKHLVALFNTPTPPTSLILVPPPSQSNPISTLELYTQLAFESLGIAYLSILPAALAASYALNTTSGVVVHLGKHASHVSVVVDSIVRNEWSTVAPVGLAHCEAYTRRLLGEDKAVERELALAAGKVQDGEAGAGEDAVDGPGADGIKWEAGEKDKLLDELNEAFWRGVFSGDVEVDVLTASGQKVVIQGKEEDDEGAFDVAKRYVCGAAIHSFISARRSSFRSTRSCTCSHR